MRSFWAEKARDLQTGMRMPLDEETLKFSNTLFLLFCPSDSDGPAISPAEWRDHRDSWPHFA